MRARKPLPSDAKVLEFPFSSRPAEHVQDGGYVRIMRRIFTTGDSCLGKDFRLVGAWVAMICEAAWKPVDVQFGETWIRLERGQLIIDYREWARRAGMPCATFHRACAKMAAEGRIILRTKPVRAGRISKVTVVTIVNYDLYQPSQKTPESETGVGQEWDSERGSCPSVAAHSETGVGQEWDSSSKEEKELDSSLRSESPPDATHRAPTGGGVVCANGHAKADRGTRMPEGWKPSELALSYCRDNLHCPAGQLQEVYESFYDWGQSVTGPKATKRNWDRAFVNAVRSEMKRVREAEQREQRYRERFQTRH